MGLLDSFEKKLESAVNGAFAKTFRSGVQPVEIASALRSELDTRAAVVSRDRILVPNDFVVHLAPADFERMHSLGSALGDELHSLVKQHAAAQGYSFPGAVSIGLKQDSSRSTGTINVVSRSTATAVAWQGVIDVEGKRHVLPKGRTVIGRGSDANVTISDAGTSRKHVEILWDGERAMVRDLNSTNGTTLNGQPVTEASLTPGSVITIGRTDIAFSVVTQSVPAAAPPRPTQSAADAIRHLDQGGQR